jgi:tetratricopeptide (TPR) repeat protein
VDRCACAACGTELELEDWTLPLAPAVQGSCRNCGNEDPGARCWRCGLTRAEDRAVHRELADLVAPGLSLLVASKRARAMGRRALALKLATAALQDSGRPGPARLQRIQLLQELDLGLLAVDEGRVLLAEQPDWLASWSVMGELWEATGQTGRAVGCYQSALARFPDAHGVQVQLARLQLRMGRFGESRRLAAAALRDGTPNDQRGALGVLVRYGMRLQTGGDPYALRELLDSLGAWVHRDVALLTLLAWERLRHSRPEQARAALAQAWSLDRSALLRGPAGALAESLDARLTPRSSWLAA